MITLEPASLLVAIRCVQKVLPKICHLVTLRSYRDDFKFPAQFVFLLPWLISCSQEIFQIPRNISKFPVKFPFSLFSPITVHLLECSLTVYLSQQNAKNVILYVRTASKDDRLISTV